MSAREKAQNTDMELGTRENNEHLSDLSEQVAMLKGLTMESASPASSFAFLPFFSFFFRVLRSSLACVVVDEEVRSQNSFLETMGSGMSGAGDALVRTMNALEEMSSKGGARFGLMVAGAIVGLFLTIWWATTRLKSPEDIQGVP